MYRIYSMSFADGTSEYAHTHTHQPQSVSQREEESEREREDALNRKKTTVDIYMTDEK